MDSMNKCTFPNLDLYSLVIHLPIALSMFHYAQMCMYERTYAQITTSLLFLWPHYLT